MAISSITRRVRNIIGDRKVTHGTFQPVPSGGTVNTGLGICDFLLLQGTASTLSLVGTVPVVNATFPIAGTAIPIFSNVGGNWFAYGR